MRCFPNRQTHWLPLCECSPVSTAPLPSPEQLSGGCDQDEPLECFLRSAIRNRTCGSAGRSTRTFQTKLYQCDVYVFDDEGVAGDSLHGFKEVTGQRHSFTPGIHGQPLMETWRIRQTAGFLFTQFKTLIFYNQRSSVPGRNAYHPPPLMPEFEAVCSCPDELSSEYVLGRTLSCDHTRFSSTCGELTKSRPSSNCGGHLKLGRLQQFIRSICKFKDCFLRLLLSGP